MPTTNAVLPIRLDRRLGAGGFGEVFLGQVRPHGEVAVKILGRPPGCSSANWPAARDVLLKEADRLAQCEHDRIVRVFGCGHDEAHDQAYIYTEFCPGGSLAGLIDAAPIPTEVLRPMLLDALVGLESLHNNGVLHRDIKPGNILLDAHGRAKLADFGLVTDQLCIGYASGAGYIAHLAPEVFIHGLTSRKTDVWAFGMTAYRAVHGDQWWREVISGWGVDPNDAGEVVAATRTRVQAGGFRDELRWLPHVSKPWRRFIRAALNDDVDSRYDSATALLRAVNALPDQPSWSCTLQAQRVIWTASGQPGREQVVEWHRHSRRRHDVVAMTRPIAGGTGRTRATFRSSFKGAGKAVAQLGVLLGIRSK